MNSIYATPLSGMRSADFQLDVVGNNIANVNTSGYETVEAIQQSLPAQAPIGEPLTFSTSPPATHVGMGARPGATNRSQAQAPLAPTGNPLDLAIAGQGFFAVRQPDGQIAYTRQVSLHLTPDGKLATAQGQTTLPPIQVPATVVRVAVDAKGALVGRARNGSTVALGNLDVFTFAAPENLREGSGGLYSESLSSGRPRAASATQAAVMSGYQLGSTVDLATEMVNMIQAQRQYEISAKTLQTLDSLVNTAITQTSR